MPKSVAVAEAKAHLSELIDQVERGNEFVITRGSDPVARLVPLDTRAVQRLSFDALIATRDSGPIGQGTNAELIASKHDGHDR